jgi:hypothetical protein
VTEGGTETGIVTEEGTCHPYVTEAGTCHPYVTEAGSAGFGWGVSPDGFPPAPPDSMAGSHPAIIPTIASIRISPVPCEHGKRFTFLLSHGMCFTQLAVGKPKDGLFGHGRIRAT